MKIIGLIGKKRSGKNLFANIIHDYYKDKIIKTYAFADPIKKAVSEIFGWGLEKIEQEKEIIDPFYGVSPRQILQHLGTDWAQYDISEQYKSFNAITGKNLWVKRFHQWLKEDHKFDYVFITDVRFPHEINYVNNFIYFIESIFIKIKRTDIKTKDEHESEKYIDDISADYEIENDGNYDNYKNNIINLMQKIVEDTKLNDFCLR